MTYALPANDYHWDNSLFWGNCQKHYELAWKTTDFTTRTIHLIIAACEALPIIGQIVSIAEMILFGPNKEVKTSSLTTRVSAPSSAMHAPGAPTPKAAQHNAPVTHPASAPSSAMHAPAVSSHKLATTPPSRYFMPNLMIQF